MFNSDNKNTNMFKPGTGNTLADLLVGGLSGGADSLQQKGYYMPMANWAGNGIARSGIQYLANPNYRDYASGGRMLGSVFGNDDIESPEDQGYGNDTTFNVLGKLSTLGGKIGDWAANMRGGLLNNGKLRFENMFSNVGDFGRGLKRNTIPNGDVVLS